MSKRVSIDSLLQEHLKLPATVDVEGRTVGECLEDLSRRYPEIRGWLSGSNGPQRVLVTIDDGEILALNTKSHLDRTIGPDDEIQILAVVAEG